MKINFLQFVWTPYDDVVQGQSQDWLCDTYVIFWDIAEECLPSRVMRQFHLIQTIPNMRDVQQHKMLHNLTRRGSSSRDWRRILEQQISNWNYRRAHRVKGEFSHDPRTVDEYMNWYRQRTVIHITNPGPGVENSSRFHNHGGNLEIAVRIYIYIYICI